MTPPDLTQRIAGELGLTAAQVAGALALFDEGNTLPFIARYRKEATGGLDEVQLRDVRDRAGYLRELEDRRATILRSIEEQGKLDDALRARLEAAATKQALEDLYLPYKPKRRTRATIARERGLEPLAERIWAGDGDAAVVAAAAGFVNPERGVDSAEDALQGARDILAERVAEDAEIRGWVRDLTRREGWVRSTVLSGRRDEVSKFQDYYDFSQKLTEIPSHRVLAIRRGEAEGYLLWSIDAPVAEIGAGIERRLLAGRQARDQLALIAADAYRRLLAPSIAAELRLELKTRADEEAIGIFGSNLEQLLLAPPAGEAVVLGLDPGYRTGVKAAVVNRTGAVVATDTLFLHQPDRFADALTRLIARHAVAFVAIGNGTASRETESAVREALARMAERRPQVVVVNEAGASVYSASDIARQELPELDVSLRGAVSIARRLQDPLAELVKIDPRSIGVGQYQHDVSEPRLKQRLDDVVESSVNRVGVEVNTASAPLLSYVAGVGPTLARNIVAARDERGGFRSRRDLLRVPRLGAKAFEQAAGFLRVRGGAHPLDASAVHPERYALVETIARDLGAPLAELVTNDALIDRIDPQRYVGADVGLPTLRDILAELRKPGRDPRETFEAPAFRDDVREVADLKEGMVLEGVVTNVVAFGAFVDVGVHQDGLVHVSQLADRYVKDPNDVVKVGMKVKVTVQSVDLPRSRIALSMRTDGGMGPKGGSAEGGTRRDVDQNNRRTNEQQRSPLKGGFKPAAKPFVPTKGAVAPNGIRFK
jgi:protein Tex